MQIVQVLEGMAAAADAEAVGATVARLGREVFGLRQCGVSWLRTASVPDGVPWWVREPTLFDELYRSLQQDHAPVLQAAGGDGIHKLLLPVVEPTGLLGAICVGHDAPLTVERQRDLTTLATHVSVRLVHLGARIANRNALRRLTPRQIDVALLAARGRPNAAIAASLGLSENTVKKHLKDIFDSLGVSNRTELAIRVGGAGSASDAPPQPLRLASGDL